MAEESLDEILSGTPPATETPKAEATTEQPPATSEGAVRDEHGRFAPKAPATPEAAPQTPATPETEPRGNGLVPQEALHESRRKEQEEREARIRLEARLEAMERAQQKPATPVEPVKPPDFWEGPDKYVEHALSPFQQQMQQQKETFSQRLAVKEYGAEAVNAARNALGEAINRDPSNARPIHQKIMASLDPYEDLVQWHKQVTNQQRIGSDPDAFVKSEIDKIVSDPAKKAELLARLTGRPAPAADQGQTPTNITRLPPSLSRLPGGNATPVQAEETLEDILHAPRRAR